MNQFAVDVQRELFRARSKHTPINSLHEGYAVLLEEVDELWDCVRRKDTDHRGDAGAYEELIQIGAMAQRIAEDVVCSTHRPADEKTE